MGKHDAARRELKAARRNLDRVMKREVAKARAQGRKRADETPAYRAANGRVVDAERRLPWWLR